MQTDDQSKLLTILRNRFEKNMHRHPLMEWSSIETRLLTNSEKLSGLLAMEESGGEPDVIDFDAASEEYHFYDCSPETPKGRRSLCYDDAAHASRKEYKPSGSAMGMAGEMGIEILTPELYHRLQQTGAYDTKTSSWLLTPPDIREKGGALFGDFRFGHVFVYHNGAESYYGVRGFRGILRI